MPNKRSKGRGGKLLKNADGVLPHASNSTEVPRKQVQSPGMVLNTNSADEFHPLSSGHPITSSNNATKTVSSCSSNLEKISSLNATHSASNIQPLGEKLTLQEVLVPLKPNQKTAMAVRQKPGTAGKPINLITNYFMLTFDGIDIYHYDVDIRQNRYAIPCIATNNKTKGREFPKKAAFDIAQVEEKKPSVGKQRCHEIITEWIKSEALQKFGAAYDGQKNIYTAKPLPFDGEAEYEIQLKGHGKVKSYQVVIKPVKKQGNMGNKINIEPLKQIYNKGQNEKSLELPQEIIMAFDTIMLHRNPPFDQIQVGRSFFLLQQDSLNLGRGLELWFGYNQSVRLTQMGPAVVINYSAKPFCKGGSVIQLASEILGFKISSPDLPLKSYHFSILDNAFCRLQTVVNHQSQPRKYIIKGVTKKSANLLEFTSDGKEISVANYFEKAYNKSLKYPFLPCLEVVSIRNKVYLPFEVCEIPEGQVFMGDLSENVKALIIKNTAILPQNRLSKIRNEAQVVNNKSQVMNDFGLSMDLEPIRLQGRILDPPVLGYKKGDTTKPLPSSGKWNMSNLKFLQSNKVCSWVLISFANQTHCGKDCLIRFCDTLCSTAQKAGLYLEPVKEIRILNSRCSTMDAMMFAKKLGVTIAVVILGYKDSYHSYEEVKFIGDIKLRLLTQCFREITVTKFTPVIALQVLLQWNCKIGGVNHMLNEKYRMIGKDTMIFGADAVHSAHGFRCPSVAAVVGSMDSFPSQYAVTCRAQENADKKKMSQEIILELKEMVKELLHSFKQHNGKYPKKIVFFRDGVSEGQFNQVVREEVNDVILACSEELGVDNIPPLTFIIVQKRHQTRFFPQKKADGVGKMGNIPPGTTVDRYITHPSFFDFFLCSHAGIQGTSKPAHYTVLVDENEFTSDELQQLIYHLCYTYVGCNHSVSIPAPVMYADLACWRAKKYADFIIKRDYNLLYSNFNKLQSDIEETVRTMSSVSSGIFYV